MAESNHVKDSALGDDGALEPCRNRPVVCPIVISTICNNGRNSNDQQATLGAFALTMVSGEAFADSTTGSTALDNKEMMAPFYSDAEMKTIRSDEEFKAA